ncbi:MAG: glycosyltransferase family 4 protein [Agathobacter sp.]|nr:glycosyltransferase family 4 protein [Agathobacter sp.]
MKIFFYINVLGGGGAERVVANLANQLAVVNHDVTVVTSYLIENEYTLNKGVKRYQLENEQYQDGFLQRNIRRVWRLRKLLKRENPDILISFMAEPNYRAIIASLGLRTKTLISVRNDPNREYAGKIGNLLGRYLLPLADGCVFQTEDAKNWFPLKLQNKSKIIFNAVREDFYHVKRNPVKGTIVTCGRLNEQKNHKMLIQAFEIIAQKFEDVNLHIYGEGNLRNELTEFIQSKGLEERVILKGATSDVEGVLASADIFVMSSDYEGMPNALMEALTVGVPCISTDCPCGGPRMLIKNGENGLLVPVGDSIEMADGIERILVNKEMKNRFGQNARESASLYHSDRVFREWQTYIEGVCNEF